MNTKLLSALADHYRATGLTKTTFCKLHSIKRENLYHYEMGIIEPRVGRAIKLARILGKTVEELFGSEESGGHA